MYKKYDNTTAIYSLHEQLFGEGEGRTHSKIGVVKQASYSHMACATTHDSDESRHQLCGDVCMLNGPDAFSAKRPRSTHEGEPKGPQQKR
jgi:hypothetical protein